MNQFLSDAVRHFKRRGEAGQSLIILALGFIALIGFVGIVTDVSLLFVRYSSLRRAVDAAAVAAAGQFRRVADDPSAGVAGEAASLATLTLAARQFIELYGLNPSNVLVETCRAQNIGRDSNGNPIFVNPGDEERYRQLCTPDELKLVRVTAQIESPTVFLRLLGQPSIILTESAISQTAVIDMVLAFDVSESMAEDTRYSTWAAAGYDKIYVPPVIEYSQDSAWEDILSKTHNEHRATYTHYTWDPTPESNDVLRTECQWFAWPTNYDHNTNQVPDWLRDRYEHAFRELGITPAPAQLEAHFHQPGASQLLFTGFQPTYNYFGCCNDPNGDGNFDDLLCEPFRTARNAAEQFLARLDFLRGDRVAFVVYDRSAHLVDPDGAAGPQRPFIEVERTLNRDAAGNLLSVGHPQYREGAVDVLRRLIGVRAEPAFYADTNNDGRWDGLLDQGRVRTYADYRTTPTNQIFDFPVFSACPFEQAVQPPSRSGVRFIETNGDGIPEPVPSGYHLLDSIMTTPRWYTDTQPFQNPPRNASYELQASCGGGNFGEALLKVNEALTSGDARLEGAVWMMVMIGDGAAGASSRMSRTGLRPPGPERAQPFNTVAPGVYRPRRGNPPPDTDPTSPRDIYPPAGYGAFGVCPYGTQTNPGELLIDKFFPYCSDKQPETRHYCSALAVQPNIQAMDDYPGCIDFYDVDDYARDWADWLGVANLNTAGEAGRTGEQLLPTIFTIGFGIDFPRQSGYVRRWTGTRVEETFRDCTGLTNRRLWECLREVNVGDYLGEELLRYLADAGDNARIDDDYWQSRPVLRDRLPNGVDPDTASPADYGPRGPCQLSVARAIAEGYTRQDEYAPLPPRQSCGHYYNAPTAAELNLVFNEIASRMFTRLSR